MAEESKLSVGVRAVYCGIWISLHVKKSPDSIKLADFACRKLEKRWHSLGVRISGAISECLDGSHSIFCLDCLFQEA